MEQLIIPAIIAIVVAFFSVYGLTPFVIRALEKRNITVVDAKHVIPHIEDEQPEGVENEAVEQLAFADRIMLNKIDKNEPPTINGDGTQAYDFIYVEDVARANVLALKSTSSDEFYNVGSGVQTTISDLCELILKLKNSDLKVTYRPYSKDDARRLVQNRIGCPKKASKDLDFNYAYSLEDGLKRLIEWRHNSKD